ncbi:MAG: MFS transporter [Ruthenibacterium lactatiformans]
MYGAFLSGIYRRLPLLPFSVLLIGRILQALGCGMLLSLTQVVVLSAYPSEAQGRVMGIYGLAVSAAPVLAPTLSGIVIDLFGWHMVFWCALILSGIVCVRPCFYEKYHAYRSIYVRRIIAGTWAAVLPVLSWPCNAGSYGLFTISVLLALMAGGCTALYLPPAVPAQTLFLNLSLFGAKKFRLGHCQHAATQVRRPPPRCFLFISNLSRPGGHSVGPCHCARFFGNCDIQFGGGPYVR